MKKWFIALLCLFFISCASKTAPVSRVNPVTGDELPAVSIDISNNYYSVTCSYTGKHWEFITGVNLRNAQGDVMTITFENPTRRVKDGGRVYEVGVYAAYNVEEFRAWAGDGVVEARVISDYAHEYEAVLVYFK